MNWLLIFVPITVALEHLAPQSHTWIFFSACVAIVPIATLIVAATEQIASRTGDAVGGLLNATFGNAPELIIAMVSGDGRSNWFKGVQLITVYVMMALLFYFTPEAAPQ
jgi:Ca2+/H+ antiporter